MSNSTNTSRRAFLKSGALVAAPVAAVAVPAAALADDGSKAALAKLQDERAIEALSHEFLRQFNCYGCKGTAQLFANGKAPDLAENISQLAMEPGAKPKSLAIADDGASATARYDCTVQMEEALSGEDTIIQMARLQGNAAKVHSAAKTLAARYVRRAEGWAIATLELV